MFGLMLGSYPMKLRPVERESVCLFGNSVVKVKIRISTVRQRKRRKRCWHSCKYLQLYHKCDLEKIT